MTSVVNNISFAILMQDTLTKQIIESGDEEAFEAILYSDWGVDTQEPWEILSCEHRPDPNKPSTFNGPIVLGVERTDRQYLKHGCRMKNPSLEAQVAAKGDIGFQMEIERMSKRSLNSIERKYDSSKDYKEK